MGTKLGGLVAATLVVPDKNRTVTDFRESRFWKEALAPQGESEARERKRSALRDGYESFRANARLLADQISTELPSSLTVHDSTHLDALWELAPDIGGLHIRVTPTEAFVLGGAILLHDLGLAVSAYPGGLTEIEASEQWRDAVALTLFHELSRYPTRSEIEDPSEEVRQAALVITLRERHASQAAHLGHASWESDGERLYLLESAHLRSSLASLMGEIAASHWQPVARLESALNRTANPPPGYPGEWTVDVLKLACLLRLADAAHLDSRRAPPLLRAFRQPPAVADLHWVFQGRINRPTVQDDRLTFDSGEAFTAADAPAWWLGFDLLRLVDAELRAVDQLLADLGRDRFAARGVTAIDSAERLTNHIAVSNWVPIDAKVAVGDVPRLVERVGGVELYGDDSTVPLRELIQNASDAIRARRLLEGRNKDWGEITIRRHKLGRQVMIEVRDNGVGMVEQVLTDTLLDFGGSLWSSADLISRLPGIAGSAFESTGRFGIGFFSVLIWGSRIQVATWPAGGSEADARTLEMEHGLDARPIVRRLDPNDGLREAGTIVRVWLDPATAKIDFGDDDPVLARGASHPRRQLCNLCRALAPTLDVAIRVEDTSTTTWAVKPRDWETVRPGALAVRCNTYRHRRTWLPAKWPTQHFSEIVNEDGRLVGRAGLRRGGEGVITVGGLAAGIFPNAVGVFLGGSPNLARNEARPLVEPAAFRSWLSEQADILANREEGDDVAIAATLLDYGLDPAPDLAICWRGFGGSCSATELTSEIGERDTVICVENYLALESWLEEHSVTADRVDDILLDEEFYIVDARPLDFSAVGLAPIAGQRQTTQWSHIMGLIATAWGKPPGSLTTSRESVDVGDFETETVSLMATVVKRP